MLLSWSSLAMSSLWENPCSRTIMPETMRKEEASSSKPGPKVSALAEFGADLIDFERMINLIRSKLWLVITVAGLIFLAAFAYVLRTPRIYESRAVIQVEQSTQKVVDIDEVSQENPQTLDFLNTVAQALKSRKLLIRVVKANDLEKNPEFAPPREGGRKYNDIELADRLSSKVEVNLRRGTRLVDLTVEDTNPELAQKLATSFVKEFLRETFEQKIALSRVANEFLQEEAEKLKGKLEASERKLQAYKEENKAVSLEERQNIIVEKLREVNTKVTEAKSKRLELEADIEQLKKIDKNNIDDLLRIKSVTQLPQVAMIREQLVNGEAELAALKERYMAKHPRHIGATTKIANLRQSLVVEAAKAEDTLGSLYEASVESESKLELALQEQEERALELNKIAIPYNVLQRDVESDRALYESMTKRLKETAITQGIEQSPFRIIEEPMVPSSPSKPRVKLILALSVILGVVMGIGVVIGLDTLDHSLRTVDEAEHYLGLPALAAIPDTRDTEVSDKMREVWRDGKFDTSKLGGVPTVLLKQKVLDPARKILGPTQTPGEKQRHPIVFEENAGSLQAEAIRTLRTSLSLLGKQSERRSFLFTSAVPSEGKSFTSLNLSYAFAQQGLKTVLIDADLRKPKLKDDLLPEIGDIPGLTDYLSDQASLDKVIQPTRMENLHLLPAGRRAPNPAELLDGDGFAKMIQELLKKFDRVIVDSPPVNAVSDALLLARSMQTTCIVVRAGKTAKKAVARAVQQLTKADANMAGFIFNRLPVGGRSAGYYYYYYGDDYSKDSVYGSKAG